MALAEIGRQSFWIKTSPLETPGRPALSELEMTYRGMVAGLVLGGALTVFSLLYLVPSDLDIGTLNKVVVGVGGPVTAGLLGDVIEQMARSISRVRRGLE